MGCGRQDPKNLDVAAKIVVADCSVMILDVVRNCGKCGSNYGHDVVVETPKSLMLGPKVLDCFLKSLGRDINKEGSLVEGFLGAI